MESHLQEIFEHCLRRFPTVRLSIDVFQARVLEILSSEMKLAGDGMRQAFEKIHHEDLFLAIACAQNDRVAWEHLADEYFPLLRHFAVKACGNLSEGEDLAQEIITRLLNEKQRLAGYNGRGSLECGGRFLRGGCRIANPFALSPIPNRPRRTLWIQNGVR
jgi:hypothetical protein